MQANHGEALSQPQLSFLSAHYAVQIFGLPGLALALLRYAPHEQRRPFVGLCLLLTLSGWLTGFTAPFSGYSAVPNYDNMFAGSNFDAEDFDDYNVLQRDLKVDGGLRPVSEEETIAIRNKAAKAIQAVFIIFGFPAITDEEVEAATYAHGSKDMPLEM